MVAFSLRNYVARSYVDGLRLSRYFNRLLGKRGADVDDLILLHPRTHHSTMGLFARAWSLVATSYHWPNELGM